MTHAYVENWRNGRFWLWDLFVFEWAFLSSYLGFEVGFFTGDDARSVSLSFGCWLFALYFTIEGVLPRRWQPQSDDYDFARRTGLSYLEGSLLGNVWCGGVWRSSDDWWLHFSIEMPWSWEWARTSRKLNYGHWHHETPKNRRDPLTETEDWEQYLYKVVAPYRYHLRSGEVQERTATVTVEEREWRRKWLWWTACCNKVCRSIDVTFNEEVGEEAGSYKGGVISCGYEMLPGELPEQTLWRMEKERQFER